MAVSMTMGREGQKALTKFKRESKPRDVIFLGADNSAIALKNIVQETFCQQTDISVSCLTCALGSRETFGEMISMVSNEECDREGGMCPSS
jgi:hypothetical protein